MQQDMFNLLVIRYGEISLKSKRVRRKLENILSNRILQMLQRKKIIFEKLKLLPTRGRLILHTLDIFGASEELKKCFGLVSFSPAIQVTSEISPICEGALKLAENSLNKGETFAIRTRRVGQHPFSSQDISIEVGRYILEKLADRKISVKLKKPDQNYYIEVRDKTTFLYNKVTQGPGGLPYGSQGKVVSLLSSGINSYVATWLMIKRGCSIIPLFYDLTPLASNISHSQVVEAARKIFAFSPYTKLTLYCVPHGQSLNEIKDSIPPEMMRILCKRMMYKIATRLAERVKAKGIVTGESLKSPKSQTLQDLFILHHSTNVPVFRPVLQLEQSELTKILEKIQMQPGFLSEIHGCDDLRHDPKFHETLKEIESIEKDFQIEKLVEEEFRSITKEKIDIQN